LDTVTGVLFTGGFMAILGGGLAWMLAAANKRLYVYEDPRIDQVAELLPQSNCGACGTAGCRNFAETLVEGKTQPSGCTVNTPDMNADKRVARLACAGGRHVARLRAHYEGLGSCRAAATVAGGGKDCAWGCLGLGDCASVCEFDAIAMNQFGLPVVDTDKCTACGDCVDVCPKDLFSLHSITHKLWVACKNQADGDTAERQCEVSCTACGRCVQDSAEGLMKLDGELAAIDYSLNSLATRKSIERCPTGAIVWLEDGRAAKGKAAKKIVRVTPLPVASEI
jgi:RnfABCDGE-type electron transport complex B subunit